MVLNSCISRTSLTATSKQPTFLSVKMEHAYYLITVGSSQSVKEYQQALLTPRTGQLQSSSKGKEGM